MQKPPHNLMCIIAKWWRIYDKKITGISVMQEKKDEATAVTSSEAYTIIKYLSSPSSTS
jgi:hypothetical protein